MEEIIRKYERRLKSLDCDDGITVGFFGGVRKGTIETYKRIIEDLKNYKPKT